MLKSQMFLDAESLDKVMESIWGGGTQLPFPENKKTVMTSKLILVSKWLEDSHDLLYELIFAV